MPACLLLLPGLEGRQELLPLLQEAHSRRCSRVYVSVLAFPPLQVTQQLIDWLAELYAAVGQLNPRWEVTPCLECAGWTPERLQKQLLLLPGVQLLLAPAALQGAAEGIKQGLEGSSSISNSKREKGSGRALVELHILPPRQQQQQPQQLEEAEQQQQQQQQLQFSRVAVGGTFDRLHAGHRLLLAATALVATGDVFVGITADNLLAKKSNKHLLQDYEHRRAAAVDFMAIVRPALIISDGALSDPQEPTQAELDAGMQALVVSAETLAGGEAINQGRKARGFEPVQLVVVGLVGGSDASSKLSSTALRQADAGGSSSSSSTK